MKNILALGAENKTSFFVMTGSASHMGEAAGDLTDLAKFDLYEKSVRDYLKSKGLSPDVIACDLHPDYRSTVLAEMFRAEGSAKLVKVQHHFAHIASCMLDNGIDEEVIGVSFDGAGYGTDSRSWGGEFLVCTRKDFKRMYHLEYVPVPGGDIAARQIWRMAVSYLRHAYGDGFKKTDIELFKRIPSYKIDIISRMIEKGVNSPGTSSAGRLFDAVSSILGVCDEAAYEAEGAIALEKRAKPGIDGFYSYSVGHEEISVTEMIKEIIADLKNGCDRDEISAKFHNTIGEIIFDASSRMHKTSGIDKVLISGGCFQNKYLTGYLEKRFGSSGLKLFKHNKYSTTDLGISAGQAVVAANM